MATTHLERFQEAIAGAVLDAGEPISSRVLASRVGGSSRERTSALAQFLDENAAGVGALHVVIQRGTVLPSAHPQQSEKAPTTDPRARVIRISVSASRAASSTQYSEVYGVFPASSSTPDDGAAVMATAFWAQERKLRNELFDHVEKTKPLSRELKALYHSDVTCREATSRSDLGDQQGEEAVSVFDSMRGSSSKTKTGSSTASSSASVNTNKASFFKSSATTTKPKPSAAKQSAPPVSARPTAPAPAEPKRVDAQTMNNVLTIDSDDDESDDGGAPKFVKSVPATRTRGKRVISDDEEDDEPEKKTPAPPAKKKVMDAPPRSRSPEPAPKVTSGLKRQRDPEPDEVPEPQAEADTEPTGPIKRRVQVTKTRINEQGYMVTEQVWEEVEVSLEELQREQQEAKKKRAAEAAAAEKRARAAAAAKSNSSNGGAKASKASGAPKQKKLDFFFTRK
ncbi:hypothetical protein ATCC90586_004092 [Pythium insidiosum]|nr:hypothetical protein ATCC90586_004092 [Pythium insidiosum]